MENNNYNTKVSNKKIKKELQLNPAISKSQGKWKKVRNSGVSK